MQERPEFVTYAASARAAIAEGVDPATDIRIGPLVRPALAARQASSLRSAAVVVTGTVEPRSCRSAPVVTATPSPCPATPALPPLTATPGSHAW
ncbi:MAG: hypothetical protein QOE54_6088 [Streptosporangiaceae bacterium]|nr:hypothetical protein [Streptosporangiaceae bacterium]